MILLLMVMFTWLAWVTLIEGLKNYADGKADGEITITGEQEH